MKKQRFNILKPTLGQKLDLKTHFLLQGSIIPTDMISIYLLVLLVQKLIPRLIAANKSVAVSRESLWQLNLALNLHDMMANLMGGTKGIKVILFLMLSSGMAVRLDLLMGRLYIQRDILPIDLIDLLLHRNKLLLRCVPSIIQIERIEMGIRTIW